VGCPSSRFAEKLQVEGRLPFKMRDFRRASFMRDAVDVAPFRSNVSEVAAAVFSLDEVAHGGKVT